MALTVLTVSAGSVETAPTARSQSTAQLAFGLGSGSLDLTLDYVVRLIGSGLTILLMTMPLTWLNAFL
jgi:hypothetical protein